MCIRDSSWPIESVYRWSWRADQTAAGRSWPVADVDASIAEEAVEDMLTSGMIDPDA